MLSQYIALQVTQREIRYIIAMDDFNFLIAIIIMTSKYLLQSLFKWINFEVITDYSKQ